MTKLKYLTKSKSNINLQIILSTTMTLPSDLEDKMRAGASRAIEDLPFRAWIKRAYVKFEQYSKRSWVHPHVILVIAVPGAKVENEYVLKLTRDQVKTEKDVYRAVVDPKNSIARGLRQKAQRRVEVSSSSLDGLYEVYPDLAGFETLAPDYLNHPYELAVRPKRDVTGAQLMQMLRIAGYGTGKVDVWKKIIRSDDPHISLYSWSVLGEVENKARTRKQDVILSHSFDQSKLVTEIFDISLDRIWILVSLPVGEGG